MWNKIPSFGNSALERCEYSNRKFYNFSLPAQGFLLWYWKDLWPGPNMVFLVKKLPNFISLTWQLHNLYYHSMYSNRKFYNFSLPLRGFLLWYWKDLWPDTNMIFSQKPSYLYIIPLKTPQPILPWYVYTLCPICFRSFAFLWCKMLMFQRAGMREGEKPLPLAFQYGIKALWFEFGNDIFTGCKMPRL